MNRDPIETQTMVPIGTQSLKQGPFWPQCFYHLHIYSILEKYKQQTIHSHPKSKLAMRAFSLKKRIWSSFSAERLDRWSVATRPPYKNSLSTGCSEDIAPAESLLQFGQNWKKSNNWETYHQLSQNESTRDSVVCPWQTWPDYNFNLSFIWKQSFYFIKIVCFIIKH